MSFLLSLEVCLLFGVGGWGWGGGVMSAFYRRHGGRGEEEGGRRGETKTMTDGEKINPNLGGRGVGGGERKDR